MKTKKHLERHEELHRALDELTAEYIVDTNKLPSKTSVFELMKWSYSQIQNLKQKLKEVEK